MGSLTPTMPRPAWMDHFAAELGKLCPAIDPTAALKHAAAEFDEAADLTPEEAAVFAAGGPHPHEDGAAE